MRVLVTGANGHLGNTLVRECLDRGWGVRGLVRPTSDVTGLRGLHVDLQCGDVRDPEAVRRAVRGCDAVLHTATPFRLDRGADIAEVAVEGTRHVVRAAAAEGARLVVTSSCNAVGFGGLREAPRDERTWNTRPHLPYVRAKVAAERAAWREAERTGASLATLLPTWVLGPNDHKPTPSTEQLLMLHRGNHPLLDGGVNVVDVRDVAWAHAEAAARGATGRFLIGGDNVTWDAVAAALAADGGAPLTRLRLPRWAALCVAAGAEGLAAATGTVPAITRDLVRDGWNRRPWFDIGRARTELGLRPRPMPEVLAGALAWAREQRWVPRAERVAARRVA